MKKVLVLAAIAMLANAVIAAPAAPKADGAQPRTYHYWLHPKLGMVKVDRSTHMMLPARTQARDATARDAEGRRS